MQPTQPLILVIDDEAHILHVVSLKLQNAGYRVMTAEDGEEALDLALDHQPDLIITDYQMPYINGLDLCIHLRNNALTHKTPCVMLTARGYNLSHEELIRTNIARVITKPFSPREILEVVQELTGTGQQFEEQSFKP